MAARQRTANRVKPKREDWPANAKLERELLGACFVDATCRIAFERLQEKDFHDEFNRRLFVAIRKAWRDGKPFQTGGFLAQLIRDWEPDSQLLAAEILRVGGMPVHIPHYCDGLRELRRKRAIMQIGDELSKAAGDPATTSAQWVGLCHEWLKKLEAVTP